MSRLRRPFVAGKIFFISNNMLRRRRHFTETDFEVLAAAFIRVRRRRRFLLTGYVFMPDHWHALLFPADGDTLPRLMDSLCPSASSAAAEQQKQLRISGVETNLLKPPPGAPRPSYLQIALDTADTVIDTVIDALPLDDRFIISAISRS